VAAVEAPHGESRATVALPTDVAEWPAFVASLKLPPIAAQLAAQTELKSIAGNVLTLALPARTSISRTRRTRTSSNSRSTRRPAANGCWRSRWVRSRRARSRRRKRARSEEQAKSEAAFRDEPFVRDVLERFDARIRPDSIKPV
jgi:hypothetical protein